MFKGGNFRGQTLKSLKYRGVEYIVQSVPAQNLGGSQADASSPWISDVFSDSLANTLVTGNGIKVSYTVGNGQTTKTVTYNGVISGNTTFSDGDYELRLLINLGIWKLEIENMANQDSIGNVLIELL